MLLPLGVFALGGALALLAARQAQAGHSDAVLARREAIARGMVQSLNLRITAYEVMLRSLSAFIANRPDLDERVFHSFISDQHLISDFPGVRAIGYCDWRPEGPKRAPVRLVVPEDKPNLSVVGFDMMSEPNRRTAIERAIRDQRAASCEPIVLVQDLPRPSPGLGFLVFFPVYRSEAQSKLDGIAFVAFRGTDLLGSAFSGRPPLSYEVSDGNRVLGRSGVPYVGPSVRLSLDVAGREWQFLAGGEPNQGDPEDPFSKIASIGAMASLAFAALVWSVVRGRETALEARREIEQLNVALERRVVERTEELNEANKELEAFCYTVSHDLRAPLRSMAGFGRILEEEYSEKLDDDGRDYLDRIQRAAVRLSGLIDALLSYSRISRSAIHLSTVDLSALARRVGTELGAQGASGVELSIEPGLVVEADEALVEVLLQNLLGNALKFSSEQPEPHIRFERCESEHGTEFAVRDNGVGFDPAYSDRLFRPFERLHDGREFPGTGIGLASAERIVRRHGGHIRAESKPGQGASFFFTLGP